MDTSALVQVIKDFLRSPLFAAFITALVGMLVAALPAVAPFADLLIKFILALAVTVVGAEAVRSYSASQVKRAEIQLEAEKVKAEAVIQAARVSTGASSMVNRNP